MKESTRFLSLFSFSDETFVNVFENSKELCQHSSTPRVSTALIHFSSVSKTCNNDFILAATDDIIFDNVLNVLLTYNFSK